MSSDPYPCPSGCNEMLFKTENRVSRYGNPIPLNFYDGKISRRGEAHICPVKTKPPKPKVEDVDEKAQCLSAFMKLKAYLSRDGWWTMHINGSEVKITKATFEELHSWDPNSPDGIDHSRDGTIHG